MKFSIWGIVILVLKPELIIMKTSLFFCGIFLFITIAHAQVNIIHSDYSLFLFTPKKHSPESINKRRLDSVFVKNRPFFLQYIPKRRDNRMLSLVQTPYHFSKEIDLNRISTQTRTVFFKMKMWRYFRE